MRFLNQEMTDIHLIYELAECNSAAARRLYAERIPNRRLPNKKTFQRLHERLRDTGSFNKRVSSGGRPRTTRTVQLEERILNYIEENDSISIRGIAAIENITHTTVWTILRKQQLYPYHIQRVQFLNEHDFPQRIAFCTWFLQMFTADHYFLSAVLFTHEAGFSRDGIFNFHNTHH